MGTETDTLSLKHYFVDEAGDAVLFDSNGRTIIGSPGCSRHFIVGFLDVGEPQRLEKDLQSLRQALLRDNYFKNVPSMQPINRKTALAFHAKDDLAEVRREVFSVLVKHEMRFYAEVQSKFALLRWVRNTNEKSQTYHYTANSIYDQLVTRLFRNHLHKHEAYRICFAARGKSDRTKALGEALETSRRNFMKRWGIQGQGEIVIAVTAPANSACLQAADYFLWALQRCYERKEDRYLDYVWAKVGVIHDISDRRSSVTGTYYTQENVLRVDCLPDIKENGREI